MTTMSNTARQASLPRRTLQYWWDEEAVFPGEIDLARMLRTFFLLGSPIGMIKFLAPIFRDVVLGAQQSADEENIFAPVVKAARAGRPAFLALQVAPDAAVSEKMVPKNVQIFATCSQEKLTSFIAGQLRTSPALPIVTIDLAEALRARKSEKGQS